GRGQRRACGLRGRRRLRPHGSEDRALYAEPRPHRADVLQPRGRWDRQGTSGARGGRAWRNHGRSDGRSRNSVSPAEYLAGSGGLVAARAVRQASLPAEDARSAGSAAKSEDQAGGGGGTDCGEQSAISSQHSGKKLVGRRSFVVGRKSRFRTPPPFP